MEIHERAGGIVLNPEGQILLVTNELHKITLPKGRLEAGETHAEAALREIQEETGLSNVTIGTLLGTIVRPGYSDTNRDNPSITKRIYVYLCTTSETDLHPQEGEIIQAQWVPISEALKQLSWPEEAAFISEHLSLITQ